MEGRVPGGEGVGGEAAVGVDLGGRGEGGMDGVVVAVAMVVCGNSAVMLHACVTTPSLSPAG